MTTAPAKQKVAEQLPIPRPVCADKHGIEECTLLLGHQSAHVSSRGKTWR